MSMYFSKGRLIRWKSDGLFYFYGMQYSLCKDSSITCGCHNGTCPCGWYYDHNVSVYTSSDLSSGSWKYEGTVFNMTTPGRPNGTYFRMFMFYNEQTKKYVLWNMFSTKGYYLSSEADDPLGPFEIKNLDIPMAHSGAHGDFYGFQDDDGKGYIVYNSGGKIAVDELTSDYLLSTKKSTDLFNISGYQEAPLMFKRNDIYYVLTGHGCCVCLPGSDSNVWISKTGPLGPYKFVSNIGAYSNGTSRTQSQMGFLAELKQSDGSTMYLWSGDRWQQASDGLHGHDPQIWQPLVFNSDDSIQNLKGVDDIKSFEINID